MSAPTGPERSAEPVPGPARPPGPVPPPTTTAPPGLVQLLRADAPLVRVVLILAILVLTFVALGFIAGYFEDWSHLIWLLFLAWFLAFLLNPAANFLQRHLRRLPRPLAVIGVLVPILLVVGVVLLNLLATIVGSIAELAAALPGLAKDPPDLITQLQTWFDARGLDVNVADTFQALMKNLLNALVAFSGAAVAGIGETFGVFIDALMIVTLAVFMAIDGDRIFRFGLDLIPPQRREEALLFRKNVGFAFAGFIRAQVALGAIYGAWAFIVCVLLGIPYAPAAAFFSGVIMSIPIYGPYVSWLPPVLIAAVAVPNVLIPTLVLMLVGWFVDENVLAPLVRAGAVDLHPIVVTVAFLMGAQMAGAIGALVSIPIAAILTSFFMYYFERYRTARGWTDAEPAVAEGGPALVAAPDPEVST